MSDEQWMNVPRALLCNVRDALLRHIDGHAPRQIPVHRADSDVLVAQVNALLTGQPLPDFGLGQEFTAAPKRGGCMKAFRFPNDDETVWVGANARQAADAAKETTGEDYDPDEAEELTEAELDAEVVFDGEPSDPARSTLRAELEHMTEAGFLAGRDG